MVYISNQGQDDRYIHLRSCSILHPVVSRLHQCLLTTDHGNACMSSTISSIINYIWLDFSRCWKSKCCWDLESRTCCSRTRIKVRVTTRGTERILCMDFSICNQFDMIVIYDRFKHRLLKHCISNNKIIYCTFIIYLCSSVFLICLKGIWIEVKVVCVICCCCLVNMILQLHLKLSLLSFLLTASWDSQVIS